METRLRVESGGGEEGEGERRGGSSLQTETPPHVEQSSVGFVFGSGNSNWGSVTT